MTVRWSSTEARSTEVWLDDDQGAPLTGLAPTVNARRKDTGAAVPGLVISESGLGFYRLDVPAGAFDLLVLVSYSTGSKTAYVPLEIERGGWADTIGTLSTSTALAAVGTVVDEARTRLIAVQLALADTAQATVLATTLAHLDALALSVGMPVQTNDVRLDLIAAGGGQPYYGGSTG